MGNQSTSGIAGEKKATNDAPEKVRGVSSPDELREENQTLILDDDTEEIQENAAAEADSHDAGAGKSGNEVSEEHKGSAHEDCETRTKVGSNESNLEEGDEEQDQPCTLKGEMQTTTISNPTPHEAVDVASQLQEDQNMLVEEIVETPGLVATGASLDIDGDHDVEKKEDDLVVVDTASVEGASLGTCTNEEGLGRNDDPHQEEQSDSFNTLDDLHIGLLDLSLAENEKQNECLAPVEEKLTTDELGNGDNTTCVDRIQPRDQEINNISCSNASPEMIKSDFKENGEEYAVEFDSVSHLEKADLLDEAKTVDEGDESGWSNSLKSIPSEEGKDPNELTEIGLILMEGSTAVAENQEGDESTSESILEKAVLREGEPSATQNDHESTVKCLSQSQSSMEIDGVTKYEPERNAHRVSSTIPEAETPPSLSTAQYSDGESKPHESRETPDIASIPGCAGVQVELRKSPSFDFGLSFETRSEESDQTPLLYQDRTATRSFSSCSNLRFQSRSVQTDYLGKYEAVEVEEKTIRMERSNSESSRAAPPLNSLNKDGKANFVTNAKQENFASDKKQEIGLKTSPSTNESDTTSPRGNGKRKPRSSLFTTCMCCTAAIS